MADKGRRIVSIVSTAVEGSLPAARVRFRNPTGREVVYCLGMNGVPAIELRVVMQGSRGVEGVGLRVGVAGRADETPPLYREYPGQGPTLASVYDVDSGWNPSWNEETIGSRIEVAARDHWASWLTRFRTQWRGQPSYWLRAVAQVPTIEDLRRWALGRAKLRFPAPEEHPSLLTRYGDEFVIAILGFANFIDEVVGESLEGADVEAIRSAGARCRQALSRRPS